MQTNSKILDGVRVAILVTDDFEQAELAEPKKALERCGATTKIIAPKAGQVQGLNHDEKADAFPVDLTLDQANVNDFDAVLLPGGAVNADALRMEQKARTFVQQVNQSGRPMAVICHAPWLLVSSGLVKGRTLTSYFTIQDDIRNAGGNWVDQQVVRDHNLVTSRSPQDLPAFNSAIVSLIAEYKDKGPLLPRGSNQSPQDVISA
ncbi:type 1 glutamine amidotransferase domain-containing protein [Dictyobacter arantiisoli]|uniref:Glutamine amidotransferase n=1 Tax=Dictyobacter arantiisoli TaxID=2014874 RepID=A0A5A5TAY1_9CHLR|nr:type 1 glutamine amidotransferase domain-containing protein [Dictyobacter arantiisoli]GCF08316.1 glutamine amidotransferase [Dictyobacter arantiisoli]